MLYLADLLFNRACVKLVIVIVTIKYSIVTTFKEYVVINTVTTFSSCKVLFQHIAVVTEQIGCNNVISK